MSDEKQKKSVGHRILTVVGIVLCVILIPMLIINCTLIVKSFAHSDEVPSMFGIAPMIVLTDSMYPDIQSGDLVFCKTIDAKDVKVGDVISFFDPAVSRQQSVVTHRVTAIDPKTGEFTTKGDANNTEDNMPVPPENVIGIYKTRIAGAGHIAMFMQSSTGFVICVLLPIALLVFYDFLRRKAYEKETAGDTEALKAELEALKAEKAAAEASTEEKTAE